MYNPQLWKSDYRQRSLRDISVASRDGSERRSSGNDRCHRARVPLDTTTAIVISLPDLIDLKLQAGLPVDLTDVEALRAIAETSEP